MAHPHVTDTVSILMRDLDGAGWRVVAGDTSPTDRPDGMVQVTTPKGDVLLLPSLEEWVPNRIYDGTSVHKADESP